MRLGQSNKRGKREPLDSIAFFKRFMLVCLITLFVTAIVAAPLWALAPLSVDKQTVLVTDMPQQLKNLKVAFASDFHYSPRQSRLSLRAVKALNDMGADLIILGGDYGDTPEDAIAFFESIPKLNARIGVFAVLGDTDRDEENFGSLIAAMKSRGIIPLINSVEKIKIGGQYLFVAGLDDCYYGRADATAIMEQLKASDTVIFAAHSPAVLQQIQSAEGKSHWFDLALFGHTHGGQIRIGSFFPLNKLVEDVTSRYINGWLEESRASILVSNGVGYEYFPARLFATPQVHLITLKAR